MKVSTATSVLVNYPLQSAVEQVIQAGFDGIDVWCGRPHLYRQDYSRESLLEIRANLDAHHMQVVSCLPAFFRYPYSLSSPNETIRQDSVAYMKDCIDNAVLLNAGHVLVVPTHSLEGQPQAEARAAFVRALAQVCEYAEQRKMRLGIEVVYPRLSDYSGYTSEAVEMIRELSTDCLGVVLDTGHLNLSGEDLEQALDTVGERLVLVHVNDNDAHQQQNAVPGDGNFDFARLVDLLQRRGYTGYLTVELGWPYSFNPLPALAASLQRVRAIL